MIGDPTGALTRNFDNMREDEGLADRATFVVDPQVSSRQSKLPLKALAVTRLTCCVNQAAQYVASHPGEVCPAKWKEGEATLAPSLGPGW
ncbi:alkyl hydroperoxide reductase subunit C [Escherichia coli]|uniref:Alkyl hydroperoxide reductase C n=1 Tax=Escherichia coli TaxID=562 RepID=A0A376UF03_ECOLX|nr:alkyl hydroperoxide reductase subunit C [Escherichia coli]